MRSLLDTIVNVEMVPKFLNMIRLITGKMNVKQNTNKRITLKLWGAIISMEGK